MTRQEIIDILVSLRLIALCAFGAPPGCEPTDCRIAADIIHRLRDEGEEIETARETEINKTLDELIENDGFETTDKPGTEWIEEDKK